MLSLFSRPESLCTYVSKLKRLVCQRLTLWQRASCRYSSSGNSHYNPLLHLRVQKDSSASYFDVINKSLLQVQYAVIYLYRIRWLVEGSAYRSINVLGVIGDLRRPVKVTFAIIYAKDYALLAVCHETAPEQQLFNPFTSCQAGTWYASQKRVRSFIAD